MAKKKEKMNRRRIMALPYYSGIRRDKAELQTGKNYFIKDGIQFDVFWASEASSFLEDFIRTSRLRGTVFSSNLNRRIKLSLNFSIDTTLYRSSGRSFPFTLLKMRNLKNLL